MNKNKSNNKYIDSLKKAISDLHHCQSKHVKTIPVEEEFRGEVVWQGFVELFKLTGHPKAKHCYAWGHSEGENDSETRYVTVLELPPVNSARTAVQASIVSQFKNK